MSGKALYLQQRVPFLQRQFAAQVLHHDAMRNLAESSTVEGQPQLLKNAADFHILVCCVAGVTVHMGSPLVDLQLCSTHLLLVRDWKRGQS